MKSPRALLFILTVLLVPGGLLLLLPFAYRAFARLRPQFKLRFTFTRQMPATAPLALENLERLDAPQESLSHPWRLAPVQG